ncbi:hypothetical protein [Nocardia asteroides]|uniref:hypothetical protein n=1 Tax=Nocardia asteroides TaxID=1824 RepID=UPI001E2B9CEC|nr:hypothetical protein [Nocardia asteroides]UGT61339.1 hypothetical protein LTT61_30130 [Nocardia asteroides]
MRTRDAVEHAIRAWNQHELTRGAPPVIDYDFHPPAPAGAIEPVDRLTTFLRLRALRADCAEPAVAQRVDADSAYLRALMGERIPLDDYVRATQGCPATGWDADYVAERGRVARECLDAAGIGWGPEAMAELTAAEGPIEPANAPAAIRAAAADYENAVRTATGSDAPYRLSIETAEVDAYWAYWLDGAGDRVRLRLNTRNAQYTEVRARQFALHEVLGHGLQSASIAARCAKEDVPWVRLLSVHGPQQVLLEGWAQAMPLFVAADDRQLATRVRLDHYTQLVRAELHLRLESGVPIERCADLARRRVPWWTDRYIADLLADRGANPQLRSYLWAYAAGIDWFVHLAEAPAATVDTVLRAAYRAPLTPGELREIWPEGPSIGG